MEAQSLHKFFGEPSDDLTSRAGQYVRDAICNGKEFDNGNFKRRFQKDEQRLAKSFLMVASRLLAEQKGAGFEWCNDKMENIDRWLASIEGSSREARRKAFVEKQPVANVSISRVTGGATTVFGSSNTVDNKPSAAPQAPPARNAVPSPAPTRFIYKTWGPNDYPVTLGRYVLEGPEGNGSRGKIYGDGENVLGSLPHDPRTGKIILERCDPEAVILFTYGKAWGTGRTLELSMRKSRISSKNPADLLYSRYPYERDGEYWRHPILFPMPRQV